jgi:hypothetical protein
MVAVLELFQVALAAGAPFGTASWGGQHEGVLPMRLRVASAVNAILIYPGIALYILTAGGLIELTWLPAAGSAAMWVLTGFFAVGAIANFASRSRIERLWGPVAGVLAICCGIIALTA